MNNGTYVCNLGKDPEPLKLGERDLYKLRVAEKAPGKKSTTRWISAIVGGPDLETAGRLAKGDTIILVGQLVREEYKPKKPRYKGEVIGDDTMPFAKILQVVKSPTFFAESEDAPADEGAPEGETTATDETPPDLTGTALEGL